ncbi:MAG: hypothetical protein ACP5NZ_00010 [Nanobdellota archaeon]
MDNFVNRLKKELKENKDRIRVKAPLSSIPEANWAELNITSLSEMPIMLSTPINDLKIRFQPFTSGAGVCFPLPYRLDNHSNKPLHTHFHKFESSVDVPTLSGALLMILGNDYKLLEDS